MIVLLDAIWSIIPSPVMTISASESKKNLEKENVMSPNPNKHAARGMIFTKPSVFFLDAR